jgi:hypothetical protein
VVWKKSHTSIEDTPPGLPGEAVHTDQFHELLEGLRDVKGLCRHDLTDEELNHVIAAINEIEDTLKRQNSK